MLPLVASLRTTWFALPALAALLAALLLAHARGAPPAAVVLLAPFLLQTAASLAAFLQAVKPAREVELAAAMADAKRAMAGLVLPRDFVEKSKLERAFNRAEKELLQLQGKQEIYVEGRKLPSRAPRADVAGFISWTLQPVAYAALGALYWGTPMLAVSRELLWPLGWLYLGRAGLGAACWLWLCASAAGRVVPALFAAAGCAPVKEKSWLEGVGLGVLQPVIGPIMAVLLPQKAGV